jgi:hypothetical protein
MVQSVVAVRARKLNPAAWFSWLHDPALTLLIWAGLLSQTPAQVPQIPDSLEPWRAWVVDDVPLGSPTPFNDSRSHLTFWPSQLELNVEPEQGVWELQVRVFHSGWLPVPGDAAAWPHGVMIDRFEPLAESGTEGGDQRPPGGPKPLAVLNRQGTPSVQLDPGQYWLSGRWRWDKPPQRVTLPKAIGLLRLKRSGADVPQPVWDADGQLWLERQVLEPAEQDAISVKVYRLLEDGVPLWLRTRVELTVSGRSREERLGSILPEGWLLATVESPLPAAVDESGQLLVQVRPGTWMVDLDSFRTRDLDQFRFAAGATPCVETELIGFRSDPEFRIAEVNELTSVDVQQTTFPDAWRSVPVYMWSTDQTFSWTEKIRGMGDRKPQGVNITRRLWLDDDGGGFTYQDRITGTAQQLWRLDAALGHELGGVRMDGQRQLITANPSGGQRGVELRRRDLKLEAVGRIDQRRGVSAAGWSADVASLQTEVVLPPGWRLWAVFGADRVYGDWLTAWTLLDLFLVLVFGLALARIAGWPIAALALLTFVLTYHEPAAPRWSWLLLLLPLALQPLVGKGRAAQGVRLLGLAAGAILAVSLVPFVARQVQFALYPQLELTTVTYGDRPLLAPWELAASRLATKLAAPSSSFSREGYFGDAVAESADVRSQTQQQSQNLMFDPSARMQTGPAVPRWDGYTVSCYWDGPVTEDQLLRPVYLSCSQHRLLAIVRSFLAVLLATILLWPREGGFPRRGASRWKPKSISAAASAAAIWVLAAGLAVPAQAQFPDAELLDQLRQRLLRSADAFPQAAALADMQLRLVDQRLEMHFEVHAALEVAIPIPARLAAWSPISAEITSLMPTDSDLSENGTAGDLGTADSWRPVPLLRRDDGYLWALVPGGVHRLRVAGLLPEVPEWAMNFPLTPMRVQIDAPQWQVSGLGAGGVGSSQLVFTRLEGDSGEVPGYDQRSLRPVLQVNRQIELGLVWRVNTTVRRISTADRAVSVRIPLLSGERVTTMVGESEAGWMNVNLEPEQTEYSWTSELIPSTQLVLTAAESDLFVERWELLSSPVWNITLEGVSPVFESRSADLTPTWQVWPQEQVVISVRQPQGVLGETTTVQRLEHGVSVGARQRSSTLAFAVESSLGGDFVLELESDAQITGLSVDGRPQPIRFSGGLLVVPLRPGQQEVKLQIDYVRPLGSIAEVPRVVMPTAAANVSTTVSVPQSRWVLWTSGPQRGPAVRWWVYVVVAVLAGWLISQVPNSPLRAHEGVLLALGLTQTHIVWGLLVVAWLFAILPGQDRQKYPMSEWRLPVYQLGLIVLTLVALVTLVVLVARGLLGAPEMWIAGNGSNLWSLNWFEPRVEGPLGQPWVVSVSIWFYRLLMLLWALWLASAVVQWLQRCWTALRLGT